MREHALWQLAEALLPLRDVMRGRRGEVRDMRKTVHGAQRKIRGLHDRVLEAGQQTGTDALREELRLARGELRAFRNELRCIRALAIRHKYSLSRIADEIERSLL